MHWIHSTLVTLRSFSLWLQPHCYHLARPKVVFHLRASVGYALRKLVCLLRWRRLPYASRHTHRYYTAVCINISRLISLSGFYVSSEQDSKPLCWIILDIFVVLWLSTPFDLQEYHAVLRKSFKIKLFFKDCFSLLCTANMI